MRFRITSWVLIVSSGSFVVVLSKIVAKLLTSLAFSLPMENSWLFNPLFIVTRGVIGVVISAFILRIGITPLRDTVHFLSDFAYEPPLGVYKESLLLGGVAGLSAVVFVFFVSPLSVSLILQTANHFP